MAHSIDSLTLDSSGLHEHVYPMLWKLRLALGWTMLFGALVGLFAVSWDIQWHTAIGRDRTLTAPHLFILGSIAAMGGVALVAVLIETVWARRSSFVVKSGTRFADFFSSSLGAYLVGYGALGSAIAFPIDQYWHTFYGIDVSIWAPFHIMALTGSCLCCLGVAYMLAESAHLAAEHGARGAASAGYVGVIVAFATLMGQISFLLVPSVQGVGYLSLGSLVFTVYPLMFGALGIFVLVAAMRALPWRAVATSVAVVYVFFGLVNYLLIPVLMTWLVGVEQQNYLPNAPRFSVMTIEWQYGLIIVAVLLDAVAWIAQRRGWSLRKVNRAMLGSALIGVSVAVFCYPLFLASVQTHAAHVARGTGNVIVAKAASSARNGAFVSPVSLNMQGVAIVAASLLLGLLGAYIGNWFGAGIGESMQRKVQE